MSNRITKFAGNTLIVFLYARFLFPPQISQYGYLLTLLLSAMLVVLGCFLYLARRKSSLDYHIFAAFAALIGFSIASDIRTDFAKWDPEVIFSPAIYFSAFFVARRQPARADFHRHLKYFIMPLSIPLVFGIYQFLLGDYYYFSEDLTQPSTRAIISVFAHPNSFGLSSLCTFTLAMILLLDRPIGFNRLYLFVLAGTAISFVFLAQGRASIIGVVVVCLLAGLHFSVLTKLFATLLAVFVALALSTVAIDIANYGKGLTSLLWRVRVWGSVLAYWEETNILIGNGSASIELLLARLRFGVQQVHNDYILLAFQSGAIAAIAYYSMLVRFAFFPVLVKIRSARPYLIGLSTLPVAVMLISVTENVFLDISSQVIFWSICGYCYGEVSRIKSTSKRTQTLKQKRIQS